MQRPEEAVITQYDIRDEAREKIAGLLGLSMRAGGLATGEEASLNLIKSGKGKVLLLDASASENAKKRFENTSEHYGIPLVMLPQGLIEKATGKSGRMAAALMGGGLTEKLLIYAKGE